MISARFDISKAAADFARIDKASDRAAMYSTREVGRVVRREATKRAPVYRPAGHVGRVTAKATRAHLASTSASDQIKGPPIPGLLKLSIKSSRALKRAGGGYSLKVGPRGPRPHLYAGKAEAKHGFMAAGNAAAQANAAAVWNKAFAKTLARYR